jgi:hypothetical protein
MIFILEKNSPKNKKSGHNLKINAHLQKISLRNTLPLRHLQQSEKNSLANFWSAAIHRRFPSFRLPVDFPPRLLVNLSAI